MRKNLILSLIAFLTLSVGLISNQTKKVEEVKAAEQLPAVQEGYRRIFWNTIKVGGSPKYGVHYHGGKTTSSWPGKLATQIDGNLYYCDIDATSKAVNFTRLAEDGKTVFNQSDDFTLTNSNLIYSTGYSIASKVEVADSPTLIGTYDNWVSSFTAPFTYDDAIKAMSVTYTFKNDSLLNTTLSNGQWLGYDATSGSKLSSLTECKKVGNDLSISAGTYTIALGNYSTELYIVESPQSIMEKDIAKLNEIGYDYTVATYEEAKPFVKELVTTYESVNQTLDEVEQTLAKVKAAKEALSKTLGLSVKAQQTTAVGSKATFRVIGLVDEFTFTSDTQKYDVIGFNIAIGEKTISWRAESEYENYNKVYKGVVADGQTILATELGYDYCFGLELTNVPVGTELVVTSVLANSQRTNEDSNYHSLTHRYVVGEGNQPTYLLY